MCRSGQLHEIRKSSIARVICANSDTMSKIQPKVLLMPFKEMFESLRCVEAQLPRRIQSTLISCSCVFLTILQERREITRPRKVPSLLFRIGKRTRTLSLPAWPRSPPLAGTRPTPFPRSTPSEYSRGIATRRTGTSRWNAFWPWPPWYWAVTPASARLPSKMNSTCQDFCAYCSLFTIIET